MCGGGGMGVGVGLFPENWFLAPGNWLVCGWGDVEVWVFLC